MKISAFIITKNESAKIAECLQSLQWVDEVLVVDDFSTDGTSDICGKFGAKVVQHAFTGFKDQKSYAMSLTRNDWVLELDADERVSSDMRQGIEKLDPQDWDIFSAFAFKRKTRFWGKWIKHSSLYPDYKVRLYNKGNGEWSGGNIHERFVPNGSVKKLQGDILHPQDLDIVSYFSRTIRYASMSADDYFARGKRCKWTDYTLRPIYTVFYRYLIRLGFLDGMHGLIISMMGGIGTLAKYLKLYELQSRERSG